VHEISIESVAFYASVWAIAFIAAFCRTVRDDEFRSIGYAVSLGATAGLFSFGAIALLVDGSTNSGDRPWYYIGIAALIGLLAKEQDKWARMMLTKVFIAARMVLPEVDNNLPPAPSRRGDDDEDALK
jgi:hypothetical protein